MVVLAQLVLNVNLVIAIMEYVVDPVKLAVILIVNVGYV
jgi:hypothetical protein